MTAGNVVISPCIASSAATAKASRPSRPGPVHGPARVAIMLALAHKLREAIYGGRLADQVDAAWRIELTCGRVSQLFSLLQLAPDLQERVLSLEAIDGIEPLTERRLRDVTGEPRWPEQRAMFERLLAGAAQNPQRG
jgi:hypothetical protein